MTVAHYWNLERLRRYRRVLSFVTGKGGVGKSLFILLFGKVAAFAGKRVCILDMDPMPGISEMFARFQEIHLGARGLMSQLQQNALQETIMRMLLFPDDPRGLNSLAKNYPLAEAIHSLDQIDRYKNAGVNPATVINETIAAYQIDFAHLGELLLIPNAGSLAPLTDQIAVNRANDPTYNPGPMLAVGIDAIEAARLQWYTDAGVPQDFHPIDLWLIDSPGEIGPILNIIGHALTHVIYPFRGEDASVAGVVRAAQELQPIAVRRRGALQSLGAVMNMYDPKDEGIDEYITGQVTRRFAEVGVKTLDRYIPFDIDVFQRAGRKGALPWEYKPKSPTFLGMKALYEAVAPVIFAGTESGVAA